MVGGRRMTRSLRYLSWPDRPRGIFRNHLERLFPNPLGLGSIPRDSGDIQSVVFFFEEFGARSSRHRRISAKIFSQQKMRCTAENGTKYFGYNAATVTIIDR
jgi:hypothetical protein